MWVDDYSPELGLYAARCDYLKPGWLDMRQRVIDIGFLGTCTSLLRIQSVLIWILSEFSL
jgi:hypothetical protein